MEYLIANVICRSVLARCWSTFPTQTIARQQLSDVRSFSPRAPIFLENDNDDDRASQSTGRTLMMVLPYNYEALIPLLRAVSGRGGVQVVLCFVLFCILDVACVRQCDVM